MVSNLQPGDDLFSPAGAVCTPTPAYKWNAGSNATYYRLLVKDSSGNAVINTVDADSAGGGSAGSGGVFPGTFHEKSQPECDVVGGASWNSAGWSPWSGAIGFTVKDAQDPIVGLWNVPDGGQIRIEKATTGTYAYVGKVTVQNPWMIQKDIEIGDVIWQLYKTADGHYKGEAAVNGNEWYWWPMEVWVKGSSMTDSAGKVVATKS